MDPNTSPQPAPPAPDNQNVPAQTDQPVPATAVQPAQAPSGVVAGGEPTPPAASQKKNILKKLSLPVLAAVIIAVLLAGGAAAYFGFVAPSKPENLWKSALNNTYKGYDKLVEYSDKNKKMKGADIKGTFKVDSDSFVTDGSFEGSYYEGNSSFKADAGAGTGRINLELITAKTAASSTPDIYVKAKGLSGLGAQLGPPVDKLASSVEDKWIFIDHTVLDNLQKQAGADAKALSAEIKPEDAIILLRTIGDVSKEYLFTTDSNKAVLIPKMQIGKENVDGRSVYHYKVGVHKEHLKDYNSAMCDRLLKDKAYKAATSGMSDEERSKECYDTKDLDKIGENDTADVWVDTKTKLIRTVRITDKTNKEKFYDIGLNYNGGDEYPFYVKWADNSSDQGYVMTIQAKLNTKTSIVDIDVSGETKGASTKAKGFVKANIKPRDQQVQITKPTNAKPVNELINEVMSLYQQGTLGAFDFR